MASDVQDRNPIGTTYEPTGQDADGTFNWDLRKPGQDFDVSQPPGRGNPTKERSNPHKQLG